MIAGPAQRALGNRRVARYGRPSGKAETLTGTCAREAAGCHIDAVAVGPNDGGRGWIGRAGIKRSTGIDTPASREAEECLGRDVEDSFSVD